MCSSDLYNITESTTYLNETRTVHMNLIGWHPIIRLCFNNSVFASPDQPGVPAAIGNVVVENGVIQSVQIQTAGQGYLAPPLVQFIGDGAGATAVATINPQGGVSSITVTNGGAGYWPVPGTMTAASAIISTGFVTNLLYR